MNARITEIDTELLAEFIYAPSQDFEDNDQPLLNEDNVMLPSIKDGVAQIMKMLTHDVPAFMGILASHPFIASSFLLADTYDKMQRVKLGDKLGEKLADKIPDMFKADWVWCQQDLDRLIYAMPNQKAQILEHFNLHLPTCERVLGVKSEPDSSNTQNVKLSN